MVVTKENFGEYEQRVCQMERRRSKMLAEWWVGVIVGGIAFSVVVLSAIFFIMPIEAEADALDALIVFLAGIAERLYIIFSSEDMNKLLFFGLAAVFIFPTTHFLAALAVKWIYAGKASAPLKGSNVEQAEELHRRCKAAGDKLSFDWDWSEFCVLTSAFVATVNVVILFLIVMCELMYEWFSVEAEVVGAETIIGGLLVCGMFWIGYFILCYICCICLWPASFFYRIQTDRELEAALETYVRECRKLEEEEKEYRHKKEVEQNRRRGDEIYRQAIAGDEVDNALVRQAADLGCRPACLRLGRELMEAWSTGSYTMAEKDNIAMEAKGYFHTASQEEDSVEAKTEAMFGYLMFQVLTESGDVGKWRNVLNQLRRIQQSGALPKMWNDSCTALIDTVAKMVNDLDRRSYDEPRVKNCYCKFYGQGICAKLSGAYYNAPCNYRSNPGRCSIALNEHALVFEFE